MALHTLPKIVRRKKRLGRGIGSRGAKSGRGQKGQRSRAGSHHKAGFEGGQTPLYMRLPKGRGSKQISLSQVEKPEAIPLARLKGFAAGESVTAASLWDKGLLHNRRSHVKLIGRGPVPKIKAKVHHVSAGAKESIEKAGGSVDLI
jgi:large subunit ribosomal protein L15